MTILCKSLYMPSIYLRCWRSPQYFQYAVSLLWNSITFCEEPAKWRQTTISIFLRMGCTSSRFSGSFRRVFVEVISVSIYITTLETKLDLASNVPLYTFSFLCFNFLLCPGNHWKRWQWIKFQWMPTDCDWVHSLSFWICHVWELSAKLVICIAYKHVCLWVKFQYL